MSNWTEFLYTMTVPSGIQSTSDDQEVATQVSATVEKQLRDSGFGMDDIIVSVSIVGGIVLVAISILSAATLSPFIVAGGIIAGLTIAVGAIITKWKAQDYARTVTIAEAAVEKNDQDRWIIWAYENGYLTATQRDELLKQNADSRQDVIDSGTEGDSTTSTIKNLLAGGAGGLVIGAIAAFALTRK